MLLGDRIWQFLPGFLKRIKNGIYDICLAIGEALDEIIEEAQKLKAQLMANRLTGFDEYYASDQRKADLNLIGSSRFVFKRDDESWDDYETRLQQFVNDVWWFGTEAGIIRELERTGLTVDSIEELRDEPYRFIILSLADQCGKPEDQLSHVFDLDAEDPSVRGDRTYGIEDSEDFQFLVRLSGISSYSKQDIKTILKQTKPPYTKGYVFFPGFQVAEEVV
ncbi:MAG TPA: hypothetical protein VF399_05155 [bacterium]|jgi:hypothetical protein